MSSALTLSMLTLIGLCIVAEAGREICFKLASSAPTFIRTLCKPLIWVGFAFWAVETIAWTNVLAHVPLSIAFPLMSLSYVTILLAGVFILKEHVNKKHALGALLITAGVACVGATGL